MSELTVGKGLSEKLKEWIDDYPNYYPRDFRFSFKEVIQEEIPLILQGIKGVSVYQLEGFAGDDQWAEIPWVGLKEEGGLGLAYLLAKDTQVLYLAIVYQEEGAGIGSLSQKVDDLREKVPSDHFSRSKNDIYLADRALVSGIVYYQSYSNPLPDDQALVADFEGLLALFEKIKEPLETRNLAEVSIPPAKETQVLDTDQASDPESKANERDVSQDRKRLEDNQVLEEGRSETADNSQKLDLKDQLKGQEIAREEDQSSAEIPQEPTDQEIPREAPLGKGLKEILKKNDGQVRIEEEELAAEKKYFLKLSFPQSPKKIGRSRSPLK